MMQTPKKELKLNIASFDLIKGFMILFVVLLHLIQCVRWEEDWLLDTILYTCLAIGIWPMYAFAIISGYNFKEKEPSKLLKSTFHNLCIPCVWVTVAIAVLAPVPFCVLRFHSWRETIYPVINLLMGCALGLPGPDEIIRVRNFNLMSCGPVWFFWAMFVAQNILNWILRHQKETWKRGGLALACMVTGYCLHKLGFIFFSIPQGCMLVGLCYVGYLLKQYKLFQRWVYDIRVYLMLMPVAIAEMLWGRTSVWELAFNNVILDNLGATAAAILFIMIGVWMGTKNWKITEGLQEMGVYSFWILAVHNVEQMAFPWPTLGRLVPFGGRGYFLMMLVVRFGIIAGGVLLVKKITKYNFARRKKNGEKRLH